MDNLRLMEKLTACLLVLLLAGCGGGGGGSGSTSSPPVPAPPAANADPGGIYTGAAVSSTTGGVTNVIGIVTENGQAVFFDTTNNGQYAGNLSVSGSNFSVTLTGYAPLGETFLNGQSVAPVTVSGTINAGVSISGNYSGGGDQGALSVTDDPRLYDEGSSLSALVGTWEGTEADGSTETVTVQSDGSFFGQSTDGCTVSGNVKIINASFNAYGVAYTSNCQGVSISLSGLATLGIDSTTNEPEILYSASNSTASVTGELDKQ